MLETIERMARVPSRRLSAQPNAGRPRDVDGRNLYSRSPEYMASLRAAIRRRRACSSSAAAAARRRSTPDRCASRRARSPRRRGGAGRRAATAPRRRPRRSSQPVPAGREVAARERARARPASSLGRRAGPPRGHAGTTLRRAGAPAADPRRRRAAGHRSAGSGARMSAARRGACWSSGRPGIETVLQFRCRDRRWLAMQAELLGAHAMGLRNLLIVTGEPSRMATIRTRRSVVRGRFDRLTNAVAGSTTGRDVGGQAHWHANRVSHRGARQPGVARPGRGDPALRYKAEAGAEFAITAADLRRRRSRRTSFSPAGDVPADPRHHPPLESLRDAEWLANEVPACACPRRCVERMRRRRPPGPRRTKGWPLPTSWPRRCGRWSRGLLVVSVRPSRPRLAGRRRGLLAALARSVVACEPLDSQGLLPRRADGACRRTGSAGHSRPVIHGPGHGSEQGESRWRCSTSNRRGEAEELIGTADQRPGLCRSRSSRTTSSKRSTTSSRRSTT